MRTINEIFYQQFSVAWQADAKSLSDLPPELYRHLFEHLNLTDLMNVIQADERFVRSAILAFRTNPPAVKINGFQFYFGSIVPGLIQNGANFIEIQHYDFALEFLETFGDSLEALDIDFIGMQSYQVNGINAKIAEKCANRLTHYGWRYNRPELYTPLIPSTFPNVGSVSISGGNLDELNIDLNVKFPKMKSLTLVRNFISAKFIDHHFPHLEKFSIDFFYMGNMESIIGEMLQKNPQIISISAGGFTEHFLDILRSKLPNLETLQLTNFVPVIFSHAFPVVRFETVKTFSMSVHENLDTLLNPPHIPFAFGEELEELNLVWVDPHQISQKWCEFFENYHNIKKLNFEYKGQRSKQFTFLHNLQLPNLKEIGMAGIDLSEVEQNSDFLAKLEHFDDLETISLWDIFRNQSDRLTVLSNPNWKIIQFPNFNSDEMVDVKIVKVQSDFMS